MAALLRGASCIIGMHPDQATNPIMEWGLRLRKPWAICPCCVFPNLFTERRLDGGGEVRTYDELCSWLLQRDPGVRCEDLAFAGRNRVFWWDPARPPPGAHPLPLVSAAAEQIPQQRRCDAAIRWPA